MLNPVCHIYDRIHTVINQKFVTTSKNTLARSKEKRKQNMPSKNLIEKDDNECVDLKMIGRFLLRCCYFGRKRYSLLFIRINFIDFPIYRFNHALVEKTNCDQSNGINWLLLQNKSVNRIRYVFFSLCCISIDDVEINV